MKCYPWWGNYYRIFFCIWHVDFEIPFSLPRSSIRVICTQKNERYHARNSFRKKTAFRVDVNVSINSRFKSVRDFDEDRTSSSFPFFTPHYSETLGRSMIIARRISFLAALSTCVKLKKLSVAHSSAHRSHMCIFRIFVRTLLVQMLSVRKF